MFQLAHVSHAWASTALLLEPVPELASGSQRGARSVGSRWQAAHSPRFDIQQHPYTLTCLHTLSREGGRERERDICRCVSVVLLWAFNLHRFSIEMQRKTTVLELLTKRVSPLFFKSVFQLLIFLSVADCVIHLFLAAFLSRLFICTYFSFALHHH